MFPVLGGRTVPAARVLAPRCAVLLETVRGRKSRHDPVAKSKEGRLKVPPPVDPVEMVVLKERYTEYKLMMRALRLDFKEEVLRRKYEAEMGSQAEEKMRQEEHEHRVLMEFNNQENQRLLKLRVLRVQQEVEEAQQREAERLLRREQHQEVLIREREKEVLQLQEDAKNFLTLENLDQRIEEALDNPRNYNFAVDSEGRVVKETVLQ